MKYNKERHLKLLNSLLSSKKLNKNFYKDNLEDYRELIKYEIILFDHIFWTHGRHFIQLIENFINTNIDFEKFRAGFSLLYYSIARNLTEDQIAEIDLSINQNLKQVSLFVKKLPSNSKFKFKKILLYIMLIASFQVSQQANSVMLPFPPDKVKLETLVWKSESRCQDFLKIAPTIVKNADKVILTNEQIRMFDSLSQQLIDGSINLEEAIIRLRGGDGFTDITIILLFYAFINWIDGASGFQNYLPPHLDVVGWFNGKYDTSLIPGQSPSSTRLSVIPTEMTAFNDMLLEFNNPKYVMTKDEALKLIKDTYQGHLEITYNEKISEWQAAKKLYHASDFGINPENYGMTKDQINKIEVLGFTNYVRLGNDLPSLELINDFQAALKEFCQNSTKLQNGTYSSRAEKKIHDSSFYYDNKTRKIVVFKKETHDLITSGIYNRKAFNLFLTTRNLGRL